MPQERWFKWSLTHRLEFKINRLVPGVYRQDGRHSNHCTCYYTYTVSMVNVDCFLFDIIMSWFKLIQPEGTLKCCSRSKLKIGYNHTGSYWTNLSCGRKGWCWQFDLEFITLRNITFIYLKSRVWRAQNEADQVKTQSEYESLSIRKQYDAIQWNVEG